MADEPLPVKTAGVRAGFGRLGERRNARQAAEVLLDDVDPPDVELLDVELLDEDESAGDLLPVSEDLPSEPPLDLAAGALLFDDPRLSVR
jgi:hypothetical protein